MSTLDYAFRTTTGENAEHHLHALKNEHPYMFEDIDIETLERNPEAVNIITAACETVALAIDPSKSGKPFFLSIGEDHECPAHKIHNMLVIDGLQKAGITFDISIERTKSLPLYIYLRSLQGLLGTFDIEKAKEHFEESGFSLQHLFLKESDFSPYSSKILGRIFLDINKSTNIQFADAPLIVEHHPRTGLIKNSHIIDFRNPEIKPTLNYLNLDQDDFLPNLSREENTTFVDAKTPMGTNIRNAHAVLKATGRNTNTVHLAGAFHLDELNHPELGNIHVLSVHAHQCGFTPIDRILLTPENNKTSVELRPKKLFANARYLRPAAPFSKQRADEDEKDYVETTLRALGKEHWFLGIDDMEETILESLRDEITSTAKKLHAQKEKDPIPSDPQPA